MEWQSPGGKSVQLIYQTMPESEKKARRDAFMALPNYNQF
jgi:hypothetical protein